MNAHNRLKNRKATKGHIKQGDKVHSSIKARQKSRRPIQSESLKKPLRPYYVKPTDEDSSKAPSLVQAAKNIPKKVSGRLQEKLAQKLVAKTHRKKTSAEPSSARHLAEIEKYKSEVEKYKKEAMQYKQNNLYLKADFENQKKRNLSERADLLKYRSHDLAVEILEVVDTFERALSFKIDPQNVQSFAEGMKMVYSAFLTALKKQGIEEVPVDGKVFDPHLCDALSKEVTSKVPPEHVSQVMKKPYKLYDKIIRFGQVVVAQTPQKSSEASHQVSKKTSS